ncbi:sensor histidine kinase [Flavobacterium caeni]|uniref:histidine kinase n=1 Tax=Flavobacterium caeni TaxID=490189 RepID=A0A1G5B7M1_9FLAO|nr:HAMP domain-containing sensor histidine kinase [Flavobacterium caeni]SCX86178.1 Signal transduction histidine kinase [Flavobacterium caeni]
MNKKLLHKTTRNFLVLAAVILLISAPIFYFVSHFLYIYEADEVLVFHKEDFVAKASEQGFSTADIALWNQYNRSVEIIPDTGLKKDSLFSKDYFDATSQEYEPFRELWAPIVIDGQKYTYTEKNNLVVMEGMVIAVAVMFLMVIAFLMTGIIWFSKRSASRLWAPFYDTLKQIQDFELDKSHHPQFADTDIEEFTRLNKSLERLIEKNVAIFKSQREFVENAAHELQTPLALFQTKLDSLSQLQMTREQSELLASLEQDVSRLNRLNKNLLLLSKIDNETYFELEPIVVNEYLGKNLEFFTEQAASKGIRVAFDNTRPVTVKANPILFDVLVNNLFINAIRHNIENGAIHITLDDGALSFANTGIGTALDAERMFNRFAKINPSGKGNGLGLAIVRKIVEVNHWTIGYHFSGDRHIFTVRF